MHNDNPIIGDQAEITGNRGCALKRAKHQIALVQDVATKVRAAYCAALVGLRGALSWARGGAR